MNIECEICANGGRLQRLWASCVACGRIAVAFGRAQRIAHQRGGRGKLLRTHDRAQGLQPRRSTDMATVTDKNGRTLASYIDGFTLHTPGLDEGTNFSKNMIDVLNVIVREQIRWRAEYRPDSVLIYRGTLVFTSAAVRGMFTRILHECGQAPSQLRAYHYEDKLDDGKRPVLSVYALQAIGHGGIWNWAEDPKLLPEQPLPPERCASILTIPRLDPAPHPVEGPYGTICYAQPVMAGSMVKAINYQQAVVKLPGEVPAHVQKLADVKGSVGGDRGI